MTSPVSCWAWDVAKDSSPPLHLVLRNDVAGIRVLADAIEEFGARHGLPSTLIDEFSLASDELMTNTISYGGTGLRIEAEMRLEGDNVVLDLIDDGILFDPLSAPPPDLDSSLAERRIGGLGVHIVRTLMDEVRYGCEDGLNKTTIIKHFSRQGRNNETETE